MIYTVARPGALAWFGLMPVVPMTLISCVLMVVVSLVRRRLPRRLFSVISDAAGNPQETRRSGDGNAKR